MKILIATHKNYTMPENSIYQPMMVGSELIDDTFGFQPDNVGPNISAKNPIYNELTALYWAKYNLQDEDIIGLAHYRRYLGRRKSHNLADILSEKDINDGLRKADVLVPRARNYYIETQEQHYLNAHANEPYFLLKEIIGSDFPAYSVAFDQVAKSKTAFLFNMLIMKQADFQSYTDFLFDVLGKVEARLDWTKLHGQDVRVLGFMAERLLNVWLIANDKRPKEYPIVSTERTNWIDKGFHFVKRHFSKNGSGKVHF